MSIKDKKYEFAKALAKEHNSDDVMDEIMTLDDDIFEQYYMNEDEIIDPEVEAILNKIKTVQSKIDYYKDDINASLDAINNNNVPHMKKEWEEDIRHAKHMINLLESELKELNEQLDKQNDDFIR